MASIKLAFDKLRPNGLKDVTIYGATSNNTLAHQNRLHLQQVDQFFRDATRFLLEFYSKTENSYKN